MAGGTEMNRRRFIQAGLITSWAYRTAGRAETLLESIVGSGPKEYVSIESIGPDWLAEVAIASAGNVPEAVFLFSIQSDLRRQLALHLFTDRIDLVRHVAGKMHVLESYGLAAGPPWRLSVLKRGMYYIFRLNGSYVGFTVHPSTDVPPPSLPTISYAVAGSNNALGRILYPAEPESTRFGLMFPSAGTHRIERLSAVPISFGVRTRVPDPVIVPGPRGSWDDWQAIPGAHIEHAGRHYLYVIGNALTDFGLEGGGNTVNGLATSTDLYHWTMSDSVVLGTGPQGAWDSVHVMICGAARTPEGKFAVTYMGWNGKLWGGIGLATAGDPAGPFTKHSRNPVMPADPNSWDKHVHVHTLLQERDRYVLLYCGADPKMPTWDKGGLATSKDLVNWTKYPGNPVLVSEGPKRYDSLVLRPRALFRHGDYYYLFYEAAGSRPRFSQTEGGVPLAGNQLAFDTIGLARSRDLIAWERHPWNPAIPARADFDSRWTAWPHAVLRSEAVYVFYTGTSAASRNCTGRTRFEYNELDEWGKGDSRALTLSMRSDSRSKLL
jgi:hypothetical protein